MKVRGRASRVPPLGLLAAALLGCVATLVGCTASAEPPTTASPSPSARPSPTITTEPETPDDVVFTVSAKVRAIDGTSIDVALTGHEPIAASEPRASVLVDDFVEQCSAMNGRSVSDVLTPVSPESLESFGSTLMALDLSATPSGYTLYAPVDLLLGSQYFAEVAEGDGVVPVLENNTCTGRYQLARSGVGTAIANYESGNGTPDPGQWRFGHYGFSVPFESGATIEACHPVVTALGLESLTDVPGWETASDSTGISCGIGYQGE